MKINPFDIRTYLTFPTFKERFLSYFPKDYHLKKNENICWEWQGSGPTNSYAKITWGRKQYSAHIMSYIIFNELIPKNQIIRHTCDNKHCVNPNHLILGTCSDNSIDCIKRNRGARQKLIQEEVIEIKTALKKSYPGINKHLAKKYNVSQKTISGIKNNVAWSWLTI